MQLWHQKRAADNCKTLEMFTKFKKKITKQSTVSFAAKRRILERNRFRSSLLSSNDINWIIDVFLLFYIIDEKRL